jgi:hypothetical protein
VERSAAAGIDTADATPLTRFAVATPERPTPVLRLDARLRETFASSAPLSLEVLALPAGRLPALLGWRESFAELSRDELARRVRPRPLRLAGPRLARDAAEVRVWARSRAGRPPRLAVLHVLSQTAGRFEHVRLGVITDRWRRLRVVLPARARGTELVGIELVPTRVPPNGVDAGGWVELGGLEQRRADGWSPLPSLSRWTTGTPAGSSSAGVLPLGTSFPAGAPVARGVHVELPGSVLPLLRPALPLPDALPAVVSRSVAAAAVDGVATLDLLGLELPVRVAARASLFPTIVDDPTAFVVLDYDTLFAALNVDHPGLAVPSEAWFFGRQSPAFASRLAEPPFRLARTTGVDPLRARLASDPLAAGTRDVLGVSALAAAALGLLGLLLALRSALISERAMLAEYEALGVAPATLRRSTAVRMLTLSVLGVVAGFAGAAVAVRLIGAFVAVTGTAGRPLPPIEPVLGWRMDAVAAGAVAVVALALAALVAGQALRESAGRRLRA